MAKVNVIHHRVLLYLQALVLVVGFSLFWQARRALQVFSQHDLLNGFAWDSERVQFVMREPFPSNPSGTDFVFGSVFNDTRLRLESLMP